MTEEQEVVDKIIRERKVARRRKDNFVVWLFIWPLTAAASFAAMAALLNFIENEGIANFGKWMLMRENVEYRGYLVISFFHFGH